MPSLLPFVLFALVATLTPGPTNILMLGHGARFGLRATLPLVLGACLAAALIVLAVGLGLGEVLLRYPQIQRALSLLGALWLSWLAWTLWRGAAEPLAPAAGRAKLGPCGAALLQAVNPKVWMMAVAVVGGVHGRCTRQERTGHAAVIDLSAHGAAVHEPVGHARRRQRTPAALAAAIVLAQPLAGAAAAGLDLAGAAALSQAGAAAEVMAAVASATSSAPSLRSFRCRKSCARNSCPR